MIRSNREHDRVRAFIGGQWLDGAEAIARCNPATDEPIASVAALGPDQVARAIDVAAAAQAGWAGRPIEQRCDGLLELARQLERQRVPLARAATRETGISESGMLAELDAGPRLMYELVEMARGQRWQPAVGSSQLSSDDWLAPLGVVAVITSAAEPILGPLRRLAAALLGGNAVVLAPAVQASGSAAALIEAGLVTGLPAGLLQQVTGHYPVVAQMLIGDVQVSALDFSGSAADGIELHRYAVSRGARVRCELAGNNGVLIGQSADLGGAARVIVAAGYRRAGQLCCAPRRVIVPHGLADGLVERLLEHAADYRPDPLPDPQARHALLRHIEIGEREGARWVGGSASAGQGLLLEPVVMDRIEPTMRIAQETIPGPLLRVLPVASFDDGLTVLNGVERQTCACLFSGDAAEQAAFAERALAPLRLVNASADAMAPGALPLVSSAGLAPPEIERSPLDFYTRSVALRA